MYLVVLIMTELASGSLSEEQSVRVHDYLDDKLQTNNDLENLDALLENVTNQQNLLRKQVCLFTCLIRSPSHRLLASRGGNSPL